eukprot:snap_masked-scaffold_20-processed-gene-3.17-mRNA-1 protein AED:0.02 eAED:0.02 QI:0/-1/0/1/-1/1/1/0/153
MSGNNILYEDNFVIDDINPEGKSSTAFKNISRIVGRATTYDITTMIDILNEVFPLKLQDKITVTMAKSVSLDAEKGANSKTYDQSGEPSLVDKYDYCMHGKVYQVDQVDEEKRVVYVSYGGLLQKLEGDQRHLKNILLDMSIYILIRKEQSNM